MWLHHNSFCCHHNISPKMERKKLPWHCSTAWIPRSINESITNSIIRKRVRNRCSAASILYIISLPGSKVSALEQLSLARPQPSTGHNNNLDLVDLRAPHWWLRSGLAFLRMQDISTIFPLSPIHRSILEYYLLPSGNYASKQNRIRLRNPVPAPTSLSRSHTATTPEDHLR